MASSSIHLATVALNQTPRDWMGNAERLRRAFNHLRELQVQLACLPELALSGYGCEDSFFHPATQRAALATLAALLPETKGLMVNIGMPIFYRKALYNGTVVIADEEILGVVPKKALAGDGIHYEPRWFKPWPRGSIETIRLCGFDVPIGDLLFEVDGVRVGYEICEEAWIADRPGRTHSSAAVDIECNPSASHFERGKDAVRERFVREGSRAFHCVYLYSNLLGCESGRQIYDGGGLISHAGEIVARGERFSFQEVQVTSAVVDLQRSRGEQAKQHGAPCFVG
ncbi:NAD+ synthetase, partial [bacterium]|nr:NAD+ synthetase [bacterium]